MSLERPLRGSCACRRNRYLIRAPQDVDGAAQVLFSTSTSHRLAQGNPLSAHIRVPLTWYHSATFALSPDETANQIRRVYENPFEGFTRRHFCGFCGTPLTYWSEQPRTEADYIQVTLGSLCRDDLGDLEDMGLIPESPDDTKTFQLLTEEAAAPSTVLDPAIGSETTSIPWFESLVEGSRLGGRLKTSKGTRHSADGRKRVEWEIVEYTDDGQGPSTPSSSNGKRKLADRDDVGEEIMDVSQP